MTLFIDSQDNALDQAAAWIVRLRAPDVNNRDRREFAEWLAHSTSHREAFDKTLDLWQDLYAVQAMPLIIPDLASRPKQSKQKNWSWLGMPWRGFAATAATMLVAVLLTLYVGSDNVSVDTYRTAVGDQAQYQLTDGSELDLNTNTVLEVRLSKDSRNVRISRGEAYFAVTADRDRPFIAACGPAIATAVGTAFNVRCEDDRTEVTVTEGIVRVALTGDTTGLLVRAGEHILFAHDTAQGLLGQGEQDRRLAWLENSLIFDETPLIEVLDELQRYTMTSIRLGDYAIAGLRVSGRFNVRDPDLVVRALTRSLPIEARRQPGGQILILPTRG